VDGSVTFSKSLPAEVAELYAEYVFKRTKAVSTILQQCCNFSAVARNSLRSPKLSIFKFFFLDKKEPKNQGDANSSALFIFLRRTSEVTKSGEGQTHAKVNKSKWTCFTGF
jgi:hypothetical protein